MSAGTQSVAATARGAACQLEPWQALAMATSAAQLCRIAAVAVRPEGVTAFELQQHLLAMDIECTLDFAADLKRLALFDDVQCCDPSVNVVLDKKSILAAIDQDDSAGAHRNSLSAGGEQ